VGIYGQDPTISNFQPDLRIDGLANSTGKMITPIKLGKLHFPGGWNRQDDGDQPVSRVNRHSVTTEPPSRGSTVTL